MISLAQGFWVSLDGRTGELKMQDCLTNRTASLTALIISILGPVKQLDSLISEEGQKEKSNNKSNPDNSQSPS